jgi:hypothetical protein
MQTQVTSVPVDTSIRARVFYGSTEETLTFTVGNTVEQCDQLAVLAFQIVTNPNSFGLFRDDGVTELLPITALIVRVEGHQPPPGGTVGIRENERLILRPSTVRGGS